MSKEISSEMKKFKEEFDFIHKKIGKLEWERATIFLGRKGVAQREFDLIDEQIDNYRNNMLILIEKIKEYINNNKKF